MAVAKCENGHFFDNEKFDRCPHCDNPLPKRRSLSEEMTRFEPNAAAGGARIKIPMPAAGQQEEKTVGLYRAAMGIEPVVGWLVCTEGREKGRSYPLHVGRNFVGRSIRSDVAIPDDEQISREDHCSVVFEPKSCQFLLARGLGEVLLLEGKALESSARLRDGDCIDMGSCRFVFIPFCKEGRSW